MLVAIFSGTREATKKAHEETVRNRLLILKPAAVIVGGAKGIDTITENLCKEMNIPVLVVTADWNKLGKAAGSKRNARMLSLAQILFFRCDIRLVAFPATNVASNGTEDMIKKATDAGILVDRIDIEVEKEVWEWTTTTGS